MGFLGTKIYHLFAIKNIFLQHVSNFMRLQVMKENIEIIQVEKSDTKYNLAKNGRSDCYKIKFVFRQVAS